MQHPRTAITVGAFIFFLFFLFFSICTPVRACAFNRFLTRAHSLTTKKKNYAKYRTHARTLGQAGVAVTRKVIQCSASDWSDDCTMTDSAAPLKIILVGMEIMVRINKNGLNQLCFFFFLENRRFHNSSSMLPIVLIVLFRKAILAFANNRYHQNSPCLSPQHSLSSVFLLVVAKKVLYLTLPSIKKVLCLTLPSL